MGNSSNGASWLYKMIWSDSPFKEKISLTSDIDLLEETTEDICESGLKMMEGMNRQEVLIIPKKQINQGFFEKLFHFFK